MNNDNITLRTESPERNMTRDADPVEGQDLITFSRSEVAAQSLYFRKNLSAQEALIAVQNDFSDRINSLDATVKKILDSDTLELISEFSDTSMTDLPSIPLTTITTMSLFAKGRTQISTSTSTTDAKANKIMTLLRSIVGDAGTIWLPRPDINNEDSIVDTRGRIDIYSRLPQLRNNLGGQLRIPGYSIKSYVECEPYHDNHFDEWTNVGVVLSLVECTMENPTADDLKYCGWWMLNAFPLATSWIVDCSHPTLNSRRDSFYTLSEVIQGVMSTSSIYQVFSEGIQNALYGSGNVSDLIAGLGSTFSGFSAEVKSALDVIKQAGSGIQGIASAINVFFKGTAEAAEVNANQFTFSDNSQLVPNSFGVTVFANAIKTAAQVVSAVALVFGRGIVAVASLIVSGIVKLASLSISQLKSMTRAHFNPNNNISAFKNGLFQLTIPLSDFENSFSGAKDLLLMNGCIYVKCPGGMVIYFIKNLQYDENGNVDLTNTMVGCEGHVSYDVIPDESAIDILYNRLVFDGSTCKGITLPRSPYVALFWEGLMDEQPSFDEYIKNMDEESLDVALRKTYIVNFAFMLMRFFSSSTHEVTMISGDMANHDFDGIGHFHKTVQALCEQIVHLKTGQFSLASWARLMDNSGSPNFAGLYGANYDELGFENSGIEISMSPGSLSSLKDVVSWHLIQSLEYSDDYGYVPLVGSVTYMVEPAVLDGRNFWAQVILTSLATIAIATAATVATIKIRKSIQQTNSKRQARIEQAWSHYTDNPTDDNYLEYRKLVKSNNRWALLTGGTKYSTVNYWDSSSSSSDGALSRLQGFLGDGRDSQGQEVDVNRLYDQMLYTSHLIR